MFFFSAKGSPKDSQALEVHDRLRYLMVTLWVLIDLWARMQMSGLVMKQSASKCLYAQTILTIATSSELDIALSRPIPDRSRKEQMMDTLFSSMLLEKQVATLVLTLAACLARIARHSALD